MSLKKAFLLIVSLAILAWAILALFKIAEHPNSAGIRAVLKNRAQNIVRNFWDSIVVSRRPPLTTVELEEYLKQNLPVPFAEFSQEDWDWFWELVYGRFSEPSWGWPRRSRQLTREEIEGILADSYERPFGSFNQRQWDVFWQSILKGRVF